MKDGEKKDRPDFRAGFRKMAADSLSRKNAGEIEKKKVLLHAFGAAGMVGWLVVTPLALFTIAGIWLEKKFPARFSWTLTFIVVGVCVGCFLAWRWIDRARQK